MRILFSIFLLLAAVHARPQESQVKSEEQWNLAESPKTCNCPNEPGITQKVLTCTKEDFHAGNNSLCEAVSRSFRFFVTSDPVPTIGKTAEESCVPGTVFKVNCNTCQCLDNGRDMECSANTCSASEGVLKVKEKNRPKKFIRVRRQVSCAHLPSPTRPDCDACFCTEYGDVICRCRDGHYVSLIRSSRRARSTEICTPGSTFKKDCNSCTCSEDGTSMTCTEKGCPLSETSRNKDLRKLTRVPLYRTTRQVHDCEPGSIYRIGCNDCTCSEDGMDLVCKRTSCLPEMTFNQENIYPSLEEQLKSLIKVAKNPPVCHPGALHQVGCNLCICSDDGTYETCTKHSCSSDNDLSGEEVDINEYPSVKSKRSALDAELCVPGSTYNVDCNKCSCGEDGLRIECILMACPEEVPVDLDLAEEVHVNSTDRMKKDVIENQNQSGKKQDTLICLPGSDFILDCNTCLCSNDGTRMSCTLMACPSPDPPKINSTRLNSDNATSLNGNSTSLRNDSESSTKVNLTNLENSNNTKSEVNFSNLENHNETNISERDIRNVKSDDELLGTYSKACEANTSFKVDCNTCYCSVDGNAVVCTQIICPSDDKITNEIGSTNDADTESHTIKKRDTELCSPNTEFKMDCNSCKCSSDGTRMSCTEMHCPTGHPIPNPDEVSYPGGHIYCSSPMTYEEGCITCNCFDHGRNFFCQELVCSKAGETV